MTVKKNPNLSKREALVLAWKSRKDYKGYDKSKGSSFNSWRSMVYTIKGKKIGFPKCWKNYDMFVRDIQGEWEKGKIACRINTKLPHSKKNSFWGNKGYECISRLSKLNYNEKTKTLIEWANELELNYQGIRQRYFRYYKNGNYTEKEVLFGKEKVLRKSPNRDKHNRLVGMMGAYKLNDKKKGYNNDINFKFAEALTFKGCVYCGDKNRIGLDRIDNSKGHTKHNVVPCCYECNVARNNNFSFKEMKIIGKAIREVKKCRLQKKK